MITLLKYELTSIRCFSACLCIAKSESALPEDSQIPIFVKTEVSDKLIASQSSVVDFLFRITGAADYSTLFSKMHVWHSILREPDGASFDGGVISRLVEVGIEGAAIGQSSRDDAFQTPSNNSHSARFELLAPWFLGHLI
jgi:hypothetical protein